MSKFKKVLTGLTVVALTVGTAQAGLFTHLSNFSNKTVRSVEFNIEASGWDLRAYAFVPPNSPNTTCIFVAGSKKGGLACYPTEDKK